MRAKLAWALLLVAALLPVAGLPAAAEDRAPISITDIRQESTDRSTRLTVECSAPVAYATFSPDPLTLVVDIPEADTSKVPARINVGTREVESLRVTTLGRADGRSMARLEVHLASLVPFKVFSKDKALNLVFERGGQATASPDATAPVAEAPAPAPMPEAADAAPAPAPRPEPAPPAPTLAKGPASAILGVTQSLDAGQLAITVQANGSLRYQDFFLGNPDRLVIDFKDVVTRATKGLDVAQGPVRKVRIGQFSAAAPKVARLVLDLSARSPYHIVEARDGVKILFGDGGRNDEPGSARRAPDRAGARAHGGGDARTGGRAGTGAAPAGGARSSGPPRSPGAPEGVLRGEDRRPGPEGLHRASDQHGLQGRGRPGHLPPLRRHQRPERRCQPGRQRQGHPQADGSALGPGPRSHPEDQRPRQDDRRQRDPDRPTLRPPEGGGGPAQAEGEPGPRRRSHHVAEVALLRQGRRASDGRDEGRSLGARDRSPSIPARTR